ncbi:MAG: GTPase, partial [Thermoguttaceae bacterium]
MTPHDDTIAAIASPPGGAARGIVRLSGPGLRNCLERCFRPDEKGDSPHLCEAPSGPFRQMGTVPFFQSITTPTAVPGLVWLAGFASPVPCELYLWPGKRSYTGQSVAEIHTLGSPPVLEAVLRAVCRGGARLAEPGEFTLRAVLAGRIDLTQAEAVLGVIEAEDPAELHAALAQLAGGLAAPLHRLRDVLLDLLANLEAGLDFADEDLAFISPEELAVRLDSAAAEAGGLSQRIVQRGDTAERIRVVVAGRPNTGKSSLFNALARGADALVSDQPGTTRDYLTAELDLDGVKCQLIDTAGIGETSAETAGPHQPDAQARELPDSRPSLARRASDAGQDLAFQTRAAAAEQTRRAHVQLLCIDSSRPLDPWEEGELAHGAAGRRIVVWTKADLAPLKPPHCHGGVPGEVAIETSSLTGQGLDLLRKAVREAVLHAMGPQGDVV